MPAVALSRGRQSNRIYAVNGATWQEALSGTRAHALAVEQRPERRAEQQARHAHDRTERVRDQHDRDRQPGRGIAM
ncbi:MAG: hypothetical protein ACRDYX_10895 [Egibacteraceae bacterium]